MLKVIVLLILAGLMTVISASLMTARLKTALKHLNRKGSKENLEKNSEDASKPPSKKITKIPSKIFTFFRAVILSVILILPEVITCIIIFLLHKYSLIFMIITYIYFAIIELLVFHMNYIYYLKIVLHPEKCKEEEKVDYSKIKQKSGVLLFLFFFISIITFCYIAKMREVIDVTESNYYEVIDLYACEYDEAIGYFEKAENSLEEGTVLFVTVKDGLESKVIMANYENVEFDLRAEGMLFEEKNIRSERRYKALTDKQYKLVGERKEYVLHMPKDDVLSSYLK